MRPCVYVTSGWGIHDRRWVAALRELGFDPRIIRLGIDVTTPSELRMQVTHVSIGNTPVLAGPLNTVAVHLTGMSAPVIGLSWGFDLHTMAERDWLAQLSGVIVDSTATTDIALQSGVDPEAITYLPWGVDLAVFTPEGPQLDLQRLGIPEHARSVLSLRAHETLYRVGDIINGFAQVSHQRDDVHLIVGHGGSLTDELRAQVVDLGLQDRVHFIGSIPESDLPALLRAVDVYISASEVDGTSVTLLQAMACGTLVLASDTAGNRQWVHPTETGYLFVTGDANDLSCQLTAALKSPLPACSELVHNGRALVEDQADWNANIGRLGQALEA